MSTASSDSSWHVGHSSDSSRPVGRSSDPSWSVGHSRPNTPRAPIIRRTTCARIPTDLGLFQLCHFWDDHSDKEHLALIHGDITDKSGILTRVHSECFTGDVLGSQRCDCGEQLQAAMRRIAAEGAGLVIYLRQEGRGIGLEHKLRAYNLQDQGYDTVDANLMLGHQADEREYSAAAAILTDLQVRSIHLMTNNPDKIESLRAFGIQIDARIALEPAIHAENASYLSTKVQRMRHMLALSPTPVTKTGPAPSLASHATASQVPERPSYINGAGYARATTQPRHTKTILPDMTCELFPDMACGPLPPTIVEEVDALMIRMRQHRERSGRPFVTVAYAQTLDGSIAGLDGAPLSISGPESMRMTHRLRTLHDAILVGIGTVISDNPRLTARCMSGVACEPLAEIRQPQPIILDTHLRIPAEAALLQHPKGVWVATHLNGSTPKADTQQPNLELLDLPLNLHGQLDLAALLDRLGELGIQRLMVEGGAEVIRSFLKTQLVDYMIITIAPRFAGGRTVFGANDSKPQGLMRNGEPPELSSAGSHGVRLPALTDVRMTRCGQDQLVWGVPQWPNER